jgi:hypothetical protein
MLIREPPPVALTLMSLAAVASGSAGPARSDEPKGPPAGPASTAVKADDANQAPAAGRMFVVGRVLGPGGKPVPGAAVMVHAGNLTPDRAPFTSVSAALERWSLTLKADTMSIVDISTQSSRTLFSVWGGGRIRCLPSRQR